MNLHLHKNLHTTQPAPSPAHIQLKRGSEGAVVWLLWCVYMCNMDKLAIYYLSA